MTDTIPQLQLPRRWEILTNRANEAGVDPLDLVERVPSAEKRINSLIGRIASGTGGVFEIFLGPSGSGKTTFIKSLSRFFDNVAIFSIPKEYDLRKLSEFAEQHSQARGERHAIFLIEERDNPSVSEIEGARDYFREWINFFRQRNGNVVVIWTITDEQAARAISREAWAVGRDSICAHDTQGVFNFNGLEKNKFYLVADNTALNLSGDGLEAYGVSFETSKDLQDRSETIADFYQLAIDASKVSRDDIWSSLRERGQPHYWVLLHGDDRAAIGQTVGALTQGSHGQVDIARILDTIDDQTNAATYAKEWRRRRKNVGQLLRSIDARAFAIPPNVSVQAVRCFGDAIVKSVLSNKTGANAAAANSLRATALYKELLVALGEPPVSAKASGKIATTTVEEYKNIQALARNNDEKLNEAFGKLLAHTLAEDGFDAEVYTEKRSALIAGLQVDIGIRIADNEFICLEPTWRASSGGQSGQSTLSEGHIKPYLLDKALKYIAALEI